LVPNLKENIHYEFILPEEYNSLYEVYGGGPAIKKKVIIGKTFYSKALTIYTVELSIIMLSNDENKVIRLECEIGTTIKTLKRLIGGATYFAPHKLRIYQTVPFLKPYLDDKETVTNSWGSLNLLVKSMDAKNMKLENAYYQSIEKVNSTNLCCVCMDNPSTQLINPCGHYCVCQMCEDNLDKCPMCRKSFINTITVY
jgi:hypothetical protein